MSIVQGVISNVEVAQVKTRYGMKDTTRITIAGIIYSSWKAIAGQEGDEVSFDESVNGVYHNINGEVTVVAKGTGAPVPSSPPATATTSAPVPTRTAAPAKSFGRMGSFPIDPLDGQVSII